MGETVAGSIIDFFSEPHNQEIIKKLLDSGITYNITETVKKNNPNVLNKTFVITGTLPSLSRDEAKHLIEEYGGKVTNSVSQKTNYLVVGADAGSKLDKAQSFGVLIIDEVTLIKLCN